MLVILAFQRLRQENQKLKVTLDSLGEYQVGLNYLNLSLNSLVPLIFQFELVLLVLLFVFF